ncbi:MAG: hypothetical protein KGS45_05250 [Planctomycetes bacterium]|nr:hypothetical protein [Planctomycetota bacterium]
MPSIDDFLRRRHNDFGDWGKSLVAHLILMYERRAISRFSENGFDWFGTLWSHINCPIDRLQEQQVVFITFNYDRTIEHLLCMAAAHAGGRSPAEAWKFASRVKVIHLHGSVGKYLPERTDPIAGHLPYGHTPDVSELWESESRFDYKLYWEAKRDSSLWVEAKEIVQAAHEIYVLGVGSAVEPLNDLFGPHTPGIERCQQFLCATGLRSAEIGRLTTATKYSATGNPPPPNPEDNAQDVMRRYFDPSRFFNRRSNTG